VRTPTLVLLAGPNGAGKTTFINDFLRQRADTFQFVNPDEVARSLPGAGPARDLAAGRLVLARFDQLFEQSADVVLETTLATRSHASCASAAGARPDTASSWSI
jgi:predicted ABC-type ATPase